jgi:hypothetical protein
MHFTFCQRFPKASISLDVTNREMLLRHLEENTADVVTIIYLSSSYTGF